VFLNLLFAEGSPQASDVGEVPLAVANSTMNNKYFVLDNTTQGKIIERISYIVK